MRALGVLAVLALILWLLAQIRLGCRAEYGREGLRLWVRLGALRILVFPLKRRPKQRKRKEKKEKGAPGPEPPEEPPFLSQAGGALAYARGLLPVALEAAGQLGRRLRVDTLRLELTAGAPDPGDAALIYGQACAVLGTLWEPLTAAFDVKDGYAGVKIEFEAEGMTLRAAAALSIKMGQLVRLGVYFGIRGLKAVLAVRRERKLKRQHRKAA